MNFIYDKEKTYVVGVSGGPDSMALLNMLYEQGYKLIVCLVNYNTREECIVEQTKVKEYCLKRNIHFETIDVIYYKKYGNFEAWARNVRYNFFLETVKKYRCEGVFIAHHEGDLLETYLIQKHRRIITKHFGLKEETELLGIRIIRPLLKYTKEQLVEYCNEKELFYSIDATNLEDDHLRNKIRNRILSKYTLEDKRKTLEKIEKENLKRKISVEKIENIVKTDKISIEAFLNLEEVEQHLLLYHVITTKIKEMISKLSYYRIHELIKTLKSDKPNVFIKLYGSYYFIREYNSFFVKEVQDEDSFSYIMEGPSILDTKEFCCDFRVDTSNLKIYESSYPLTFRNVKESDVVKFGNIHKKVNRILIDDKVPLSKRKRYPIVEDKDGNIVYIPLYRSEIQKKIANKLKFVVK